MVGFGLDDSARIRWLAAALQIPEERVRRLPIGELRQTIKIPSVVHAKPGTKVRVIREFRFTNEPVQVILDIPGAPCLVHVPREKVEYEPFELPEWQPAELVGDTDEGENANVGKGSSKPMPRNRQTGQRAAAITGQ